MFDRKIEEGLTSTLKEEGLGAIVFSPLAQGLLTDRYLDGIPKDSRASRSDSPFLTEENVEPTLGKVRELNQLASLRNQTLAEMALAWLLREETIASVLVGASKLSQLKANVKSLDNLIFSPEELVNIEQILRA